MKKLIITLFLLSPLTVMATPVSWDYSTFLQPLKAMWNATVKANNFTATSTTAINTFPNLSSTNATTTTLSISNFNGVLFASSGPVTALPNNDNSQLKFLSQFSGLSPTWQTVPQPGSYTYFLFDDTSTSTYKKMLTEVATGTMANITATYTVASTTVTQWITDPNYPSLVNIPAGLWSFHLDATKTAGTKTATLYFDVYKIDAFGAETRLFTTQPSENIVGTNVSNPQEIDIEVSEPAFTLSLTDRLVLRTYVLVTGAGSNPAVGLYWQNPAQSRMTLPSNTVDASNFVPYTGAVKTVNLGSQNLVTTGQTTLANASTTVLTMGTGFLTGITSSFLATNQQGQVIATTTPSGSGTPASPNTSIQFNNGGVFGGSADLTWDNLIDSLAIGATSTTGSIIIQGGGTGSSITSGGQLHIYSGDGDYFSSTTGGFSFTMQAGLGGSTSGAGGDFDLQAGNSQDNLSDGGQLTFQSGQSSDLGIGSVTITGSSVTDNRGSNIYISSGDGGSTIGNGGKIDLTAGSAKGGNNNGGNIELTAGDKSGSGVQGNIQLSGGNVGIGTSTPNSPLAVIGDISMSGKLLLDTTNLAYGINSLKDYFFGDAGNATMSGAYNTATGYHSLLNNSSGGNNTVSGNVAMSLNDSGSFNTALGSAALYSNVSGSNNVALGYYAGAYETGSNAFYVNNQNRTNTAGDKSSSLLYGTFNATPANQTLQINAHTSILNNLSIGTTSDARNLFIQGTAGIKPFEIASSSGDTLLTLMPNGNLGIGSNNPLYKLTVSGSGYVRERVISTDPLGGAIIGVERNASSSPAFLAVRTTENFGLNDWLIGVSTSSATINNQDLQFFNYQGLSSGTFLMTLTQANGYLGIGTTSPSNALEINGSGYLSGNLTAANITATGTLTVTGKTTLANASTTNLTVATNAYLSGLESVFLSVNRSGMIIATSTPLLSYTETDPFYAAASSTLLRYGTTTDALTEGANNLFWTTARFDTRLFATTSLQNLATLAGLSTIGSSTGQTTILGKTVLTNASSSALTVTGATYLATTGGNVGIGTTTPENELSIVYNAVTNATGFKIQPNGTDDYWSVGNTTGVNNYFIPSFVMKASTTLYGGNGVWGSAFIAMVNDNAYPSGAGAGAGMWFDSRNYTSTGVLSNRNLFAWGTYTNVKMVMSAAGNLGIGTTTLSNKLEINGSGYLSGNLTAANITATGTLNVTGKTTLGNASTTNLTVGTNAYLSGLESTFLTVNRSGLIIATTTPITGLAWGAITGTLSAQTDLQGALNQKVNIGTTSMATLATLAGLSTIGSSTGKTTILGQTVMTNASTTALTADAAYLTGLGSAYLSVNQAGQIIATTTPSGADDNLGNHIATQDLRPDSTLDHALGTASYRWKELWVGALNVGTSTWSITGSSTNDAHLGIYSGPGGSGTEALSILTGGNVGIGSTTPLSSLSVSGTAGTNPFTVASSTGQKLFDINQAGAITANGSLTLNGNYANFIMKGDNPNGYQSFRIYNDSTSGGVPSLEIGTYGSTYTSHENEAYVFQTGNYNLTLGTNNTERVRIDSAGLVGINTTPSSSQLDVYSTTGYGGKFYSTVDYDIYTTGSQGIYVASGDVCTASYCLNSVSDQRLKKNIQPIATSTLDKLLQLNPVTYKWNDTYWKLHPGMASTTPKTRFGLLAQEVRPIFPELVTATTTSNPNLSVDYNMLSVLNTEAIKELNAKVDAQQKEIDALQARLKAAGL